MFKKKKMAIAFAVLLSVLILPAAHYSNASTMKKTVDAWYRDIKIVANGTQVQMPLEPFIVNDRTYVSVSSLASLLDKNVTWDNNTSTVTITDKPGYNAAILNNTILQQNTEITKLKAQIEDLKKQLDKANSSSGDLSDLEDELQDDYSDFKDIEFDISLDGDEDEIEVAITFDGDDYSDEWDALTNSNIQGYLQDIVDDILDEFDDADIEGSIEDTDNDEVLVEFTVDSDGDVSTDSSNFESDLDDLEDELNDDYGSYYDDVDLSISLSGNEDSIKFYVDVDVDEWDTLSNSKKESILNNIYDDISDEFDDATVKGYVDDGSTRLGTYTSSGGYDAN